MLIGFLCLTAVVVVLEHFTFGRWWAHNELARRTMGHATILGLALLFVPSGFIDLGTLVSITLATGTAGAITAALVVTQNEHKRRQRTAVYRREVEQYDQTPR